MKVKRIVAVISLCSIMSAFMMVPLSGAKAVSIDDLRRQQEQLQSEIDAKNQEANRKQAEANRLSNEVATLDNDITATEQQISNTENQVASVRSQIGDVKSEISTKEEDLRVQRNNFNKAVVELYRAGQKSNIEKLLGSTDLADAIEQTTYLDSVQEHVYGIVESITAIKKELEEKKSSLESRNNELNSLLTQQASQKNALAAQREVKDGKRQDAQAAASSAVAAAKSAEKQMGSIDDAIRRALAANGGQSPGALSGKYVSRGTWLGNMGSTGNSTGPHLHFEVRTRGGYGGDGSISDFNSIGYYNASSPASNCSVGMNGNNLSFNYGFSKPLSNPWVVTSCFPSYPGGGYHGGIDMVEYNGAPVHAAMDGTVVFHGWLGAYGNVAVIYHGNGLWSLYAHML